MAEYGHSNGYCRMAIKIVKHKQTGIFGTMLACLLFFFIGCENSMESWRLDYEYSEYLTIMSTDYKSRYGYNSSDTVDGLRIYRTKQKHYDMYSLNELFSKELVYESKDKQFIKNFIEASQEAIMSLNCVSDNEKETFHIIAFNNKSMHAGYYLVNVCSSNSLKYVIIHPLQKEGGSSIYYNSSLIPLLKEKLHLIE